jgi:hypothetical protein
MKTPTDPFFAEPADVVVAARALTLEVASRLFIWMNEGPTLHERGVRATVALYCIRPDLIPEATLEEIGHTAGRSRQAIHQIAASFRETTGIRP